MYSNKICFYKSQTIEHLLKKGIGPVTTFQECSYWHHIIREPHTNFGAIKELLKYSNNPNFFDLNSGESLLHLAIRAGKINIVGYLIAKGANPNIASKKPSNQYIETLTEALIEEGEEVRTWPGDTPLHAACRFAHIEIIALLLQKGANPNIPNHANERPLRAMLDSRSNPQYLSGIRLLLALGANSQAIEGYYAVTIQNELQHAREVSSLLVASGFNCTHLLTDPLKEELKYLRHQVENLLKEKLPYQEASIEILLALPRALHFLKQLAGPYPQLVKHATLEEKTQYQKGLEAFNNRLNPILQQKAHYTSLKDYKTAIRAFLLIQNLEEIEEPTLKDIDRTTILKDLWKLPHEIILQIKEHLIDQTFAGLLSRPYQISQKEALFLFKACQKDFSFWHHFNTKRLEHDWHEPWPNNMLSHSVSP